MKCHYLALKIVIMLIIASIGAKAESRCESITTSFDLIEPHVNLDGISNRNAQVGLVLLEDSENSEILKDSCSYSYVNALVVETISRHMKDTSHYPHPIPNTGALPRTEPSAFGAFLINLDYVANHEPKSQKEEIIKKESVDLYNRIKNNEKIQRSVIEQIKILSETGKNENGLFFLVNLAGYYSWVTPLNASSLLKPYFLLQLQNPISGERSSQICELMKNNLLHLREIWSHKPKVGLEADPSLIHDFFYNTPIGVKTLICLRAYGSSHFSAVRGKLESRELEIESVARLLNATNMHNNDSSRSFLKQLVSLDFGRSNYRVAEIVRSYPLSAFPVSDIYDIRGDLLERITQELISDKLDMVFILKLTEALVHITVVSSEHKENAESLKKQLIELNGTGKTFVGRSIYNINKAIKCDANFEESWPQGYLACN